MEIRQLKKEDYAGRKFTARYQTNGYYDICVCEGGFRMCYTPFASPEERAFDDVFFGDGWRLRSHSAHLRAKRFLATPKAHPRAGTAASVSATSASSSAPRAERASGQCC